MEAEMRRVLRLQHTSLRTERSYMAWLRRFREFTGLRPGVELRAGEGWAWSRRWMRDYVTISLSNPSSEAIFTSLATRRPVDMEVRHSALPYGCPMPTWTFVPPPMRGATS